MVLREAAILTDDPAHKPWRRFAVIPAKTHSRRFRGKNFRTFGDISLVLHCARKLLPFVEAVYVSTDEPKWLIEELKVKGTDQEQEYIIPLLRPGNLCRDDTNTEAVLLHAIDHVHPRVQYCLVLAQATSPLWQPETLARAIETFERETPPALISVNPAYQPNGCFYLLDKDKFAVNKHIFASDAHLYTMSWGESIDIDYAYQYTVATAIAKGRCHP